MRAVSRLGVVHAFTAASTLAFWRVRVKLERRLLRKKDCAKRREERGFPSLDCQARHAGRRGAEGYGMQCTMGAQTFGTEALLFLFLQAIAAKGVKPG
jgi:hypothetical protein